MLKDIAVFSLYPNRRTLEEGLEQLKAAGFRDTDISVFTTSDGLTHELAHEIHSKAPEGAVTGAVSAGAVGGVLGWLASLGSLTVPGIGPLVAAGPIVATLAGIGAGTAGGGLVGALIGAGMPEAEAKVYEGRLRHHAIFCAVHCDDKEWARRARRILADTKADHVSQTAEPVGDYHP